MQLDSNETITWVIHFLSKKIDLSKIKENDILTFDDGHYSILENINLIKNLSNRKILFIVPNFVDLLNQRKNKPSYKHYWMDDFFINHSREQFLNLTEIEELIFKYLEFLYFFFHRLNTFNFK